MLQDAGGLSTNADRTLIARDSLHLSEGQVAPALHENCWTKTQ
jgi:hypothetical protein